MSLYSVTYCGFEYYAVHDKPLVRTQDLRTLYCTMYLVIYIYIYIFYPVAITFCQTFLVLFQITNIVFKEHPSNAKLEKGKYFIINLRNYIILRTNPFIPRSLVQWSFINMWEEPFSCNSSNLWCYVLSKPGISQGLL